MKQTDTDMLWLAIELYQAGETIDEASGQAGIDARTLSLELDRQGLKRDRTATTYRRVRADRLGTLALRLGIVQPFRPDWSPPDEEAEQPDGTPLRCYAGYDGPPDVYEEPINPRNFGPGRRSRAEANRAGYVVRKATWEENWEKSGLSDAEQDQRTRQVLGTEGWRIRSLWESGDVSLPILAARFLVSEAALREFLEEAC